MAGAWFPYISYINGMCDNFSWNFAIDLGHLHKQDTNEETPEEPCSFHKKLSGQLRCHVMSFWHLPVYHLSTNAMSCYFFRIEGLSTMGFYVFLKKVLWSNNILLILAQFCLKSSIFWLFLIFFLKEIKAMNIFAKTC